MTTIATAITDYIDRHAAAHRQERTARMKLRAPLEAFGKRAIGKISADDIEAYTTKRMFGGYGKVKVKAPTIRAEIVMLQAALNWYCKRHDRPERFEFEKPRDSDRRDLWLDEKQERTALEAAQGWPSDARLFLMLGLTYGARKGAMLDLRFGAQVDFARNRIDFNRPGADETRKRRPAGPMPPDLRDALWARFEEVGPGPVLEGDATEKRYRAGMEAIGLGWATAHVLKHSAITLQLRGGAALDRVSGLTRTSLPTLMKHYRHHADDEMLDTMTRRRA
jgi:integrase